MLRNNRFLDSGPDEDGLEQQPIQHHVANSSIQQVEEIEEQSYRMHDEEFGYPTTKQVQDSKLKVKEEAKFMKF